MKKSFSEKVKKFISSRAEVKLEMFWIQQKTGFFAAYKNSYDYFLKFNSNLVNKSLLESLGVVENTSVTAIWNSKASKR